MKAGISTIKVFLDTEEHINLESYIMLKNIDYTIYSLKGFKFEIKYSVNGINLYLKETDSPENLVIIKSKKELDFLTDESTESFNLIDEEGNYIYLFNAKPSEIKIKIYKPEYVNILSEDIDKEEL